MYKEDLAKKVGISVACWKKSFYSIIMAAGEGVFGAVFKNIFGKEGILERVFSDYVKQVLCFEL